MDAEDAADDDARINDAWEDDLRSIGAPDAVSHLGVGGGARGSQRLSITRGCSSDIWSRIPATPTSTAHARLLVGTQVDRTCTVRGTCQKT